MNRRDDRRPGLRAFALWVAGGVVSVLAFLLVFHVFGGGAAGFPLLGCLLHGLAVMLAGLGTMLAKGLDHPAARGWALLVMFFAFFAGPLGYLAGVACYLFGVGQPTEMPLVEVVKAEMWIRPMVLERGPEIPSFEARLREELRTQPIVDLIPQADVATAVAIVNHLAEQHGPEHVRLLRRLAEDRRPEVYQYALSKLDELEKDYATRIFQLKEQLRGRPEDPSSRVELAQLYLEYTGSGLMDGALQEYYWGLTLAQLFEAIRVEPGKAELIVDLAYIFHVHGMSREAELILTEALVREPGHLRGRLLLLECLLDRAQREARPELLQEARKLARETAWAVRMPNKRDHNPLYDLAQFWFGRHRGATHG